MDFATILGLLAGVLVLIKAAGEGLGGMYEGTALLVVVVGGIAATVVAFPLSTAVNVLRVVKNAFFNRPPKPTDLIERIVGLAETARREGILALEKEVVTVDDPFLSGGVRLAVDGTEPDLIMDILETELRFIEDRHGQGQRLLETLGRSWAIFGGVGALLVLAAQASAGAGVELVGQATLPLLYGVILAGLVAWPFARKLGEYSEREVLTKLMVIEGIMAIQSGDNPRIVEHKLSVFLEPRFRPSGEKPAPPPAPRPVPGEDRMPEQVAEFAAEQQDLVLRLVRQTAEGHEGDAEEKSAVEAMVAKVRGGEMGLVALLAGLSPEIQKEMLQALKNPPPPLLAQTRAVEAEFAFEDLTRLTDREIQTLLREVDQKDAVIALKGAGPEVREKVLGNLSERVRTFIEEEMGYARVRPEDVLMTQARIVAQVYRLVDGGQISLPAAE